MQSESHNLSPVYDRLERLRVVTNRSWDQMAKLLDIDRSMFFHVKSGRRNLSKKAIFRLEQAERAEGILPPLIPQKPPTVIRETPPGYGVKKDAISKLHGIEVALRGVESALAKVKKEVEDLKLSGF